MDNFLNVFYSNRTETLFRSLKESLYTASQPFTRRIVIVPSPAMKSWLSLQLAKDPELGIAGGVEIGYIEPSINKLAKLLDTEPASDVYEPSEIELALAIEMFLADLTKNPKIQDEWHPVVNYLGMDSDLKKISKRLIPLSETLAKYFLEYTLYGKDLNLFWPQDPENLWQQLLWNQLEGLFSTWNTPIRKLQSVTINPSLEPMDIQIHAFGISYMAPLYHRFLQKVANHIPVNYYLLSPCLKFWSDLLSDKESFKLKHYWKQRLATQSSQESLETLLRDTNPMLANFGRLGREMAGQIESGDPSTTESYELPAAIVHYPQYRELATEDIEYHKTGDTLTLLEALQADIALLRTPDPLKKIALHENDCSIQVHAAPKMLREVQGIYDALLTIIDQHQHDATPILPGDIFVMAPNISNYIPYIKAVFESPESLLPIQLMDQQLPSQHATIRGFLHLLGLAKSRWEASKVLQLFDYSACRKKLQLSVEDLATLQEWVKAAGICWGKDALHRNEVIQRDYGVQQAHTEIGTWDYGLGRILEGLVFTSQDSALGEITPTQADLIGKLIQTTKTLQEDLRPLVDGARMTLEEWSRTLKQLLENYFSPTQEEGNDEGFKIIIEQLTPFKAAKRLKDAKFSFETVYHHLENRLQKETTIYRESNLQAVRFASLLPMRAVPAQVVVLMGMGDAQFPRSATDHSLNLLINNPKADYFPDAVDFDRYLFLEALLAARQYFLLSYVSQEPGESNELLPSLLIKELLGYLDKAFTTGYQPPSELCTYKHSLNAYHHQYFTEGSRFKSYSIGNYRAALANYGIKKPAHTFLPSFTPHSDGEEWQTQRAITLQELIAYAKNPLKSYLNSLGIYLSRSEDPHVSDEEELYISDLNAAILARQGLFTSASSALARGESTGMVPQGSFLETSRNRVEQEISTLKANLNAMHIDPQECSSIEFSERSAIADLSGKCWILPPLELETKFGTVMITGQIDTISSRGLLLLKEDKIDKAIEAWPIVLIFQCLLDKYSLPSEAQVIFVKGDTGKIKPLEFDQPEILLTRFIEYYLQSKTSPSPLVPEWVQPILSGNPAKIQKCFADDSDSDFSTQFNRYLFWLQNNSPGIQASTAIEHWQKTAESLYVNMPACWYGKGEAKV